jgi:prepilin-type N-terminal cleavage/methylation domain-containing protein
MWAKPKGFTIVELLVVIVVIAILAAITVVAYNGIQTRAKNVKTISAATAWIKALKLYNADKGTWPTSGSCLGGTSTYSGSGGQCWNDPWWVVKSAFLSDMQPYLSTLPEPDTSDVASGTANSPRRGLMYNTNNTDTWTIYLFQSGSGSCPSLGIPLSSGPGSQGSGYLCIYNLNP